MAVTTESYAGKIQRKLLKKQKVIEAASGRKKADLVLKNATFVNVFSNELTTCDIACANGLIVGLGRLRRRCGIRHDGQDRLPRLH